MLFYLDVHIWPDVPELTLTSGADLTLKCTGDVPVKWNQNQYDPTLLIEKVRINKLVFTSVIVLIAKQNNEYFITFILIGFSKFNFGYSIPIQLYLF